MSPHSPCELGIDRRGNSAHGTPGNARPRRHEQITPWQITAVLFLLHAVFVLHSCHVPMSSRSEGIRHESALSGVNQLLHRTPNLGQWKIGVCLMVLPASSTSFSILLTYFWGLFHPFLPTYMLQSLTISQPPMKRLLSQNSLVIDYSSSSFETSERKLCWNAYRKIPKRQWIEAGEKGQQIVVFYFS